MEIVMGSGDWGRVTGDIMWSMVTGDANPQGRAMMVHAARQGTTSWMGEFKDGFHLTQASGGVLANFDDCARENQGRLYNIGRAAIGLPPVSLARSKKKRTPATAKTKKRSTANTKKKKAAAGTKKKKA